MGSMNLDAKTRLGQSQAVYQWEWSFFQYEETMISLASAGTLTDDVWAFVGRTDQPPVVKDGRGHPHARASRRAISLPRALRTARVVLHENAHSLLIAECGFVLIDPDAAAHGPVFVGLLMKLFEQFCGLDRTVMEQAATQRGIVFN